MGLNRGRSDGKTDNELDELDEKYNFRYASLCNIREKTARVRKRWWD